VRSPERRARRLLRWYPRSWRESHEDEFAALLEDSMSDLPFWPRRVFDIAAHGLRLRSADLRLAFRTSRRRALIGSSASLVVVVGAIAAVTSGFGLLNPSGPTKGGMPYMPGRTVPYSSIPDYVAVIIGPNKIGYTPKAYVSALDGSSNDPLLGAPEPIYASDLKTLLGHDYGGIGFVPLGSSPWNQPCQTETVTRTDANGQTSSTIPCQSTTLVLPNVIGAVTPTAVGQLSGLGVDVVIQNVHSRTIPPGHIVSTSPQAGTTVHARQPVVVDISVP
jgi:hypothetical protein